VIHLYAFVDRLAALPDLDGLDGRPLEHLQVGGLELVVSRSAVEHREPEEESILTHAAVVEALLGRSESVLPARFAPAFPDEAALSTAVLERAATLRSALGRLRGCVEFGLRVVAATGDGEERAGSGAEYMRLRLARRAAQDRAVAAIHDQLEPLARAAQRSTETPTFALTAAYLVPQESVAAFRERIRAVEAAHRDLGIICTGPWPPYSFAEDLA